MDNFQKIIIDGVEYNIIDSIENDIIDDSFSHNKLCCIQLHQ